MGDLTVGTPAGSGTLPAASPMPSKGMILPPKMSEHRIAITPVAYAAVAATLTLGAVAVEPEPAQDGGVHV
jgi:hypothetical protein